VAAYDFDHEGHSFCLVDTPGFDDSHDHDAEIVDDIVNWLGKRNNVCGILYLHRIIDPKVTGTARANLRMFRRLCGDENLGKVTLVTTFWNQIAPSLGERREMQLQSDAGFWKPMIDQGSRTVRSKQSREEDLALLLQIAQTEGFQTQVQKDVQAGKSAAEISLECREASLEELEQKEMELQRQRLQKERESFNAMQAKIAKERRDTIARERAEQRRRQQEEERKQRIEEQRRREEQRVREEKGAKQRAEEAEEYRKMCEAIAEQQRVMRELEAIAERHRRYAQHNCRRIALKRRNCSRCGERMDWVGDGTWCYRKSTSILRDLSANVMFKDCCHCDWDQYHLCQGCVAVCKDSDHPTMTIRYLPQTTLTSVARGLFS
jgi:hypothetical protein